MGVNQMRFPFEVTFTDLTADLEPFVSSVFSCLVSDFLMMPKGAGFLEYPIFEQGYEALKKETNAFQEMTPANVLQAADTTPIVLIVLRSILGFTPPEWAYLASQRTETKVTQGFVRSLDRKIRLEPFKVLSATPATKKRIMALVTTACELIRQPVQMATKDKIHRLNKADTRHGISDLRTMAALGVPYALLLYERFLGRPFAGHRDSVSELVGDSLESAIEEVLTTAGISFRKTKRAQRIAGFDQTPDFIIPSEFNPKVVIEAKITEDDGTARDKVTRIQHLATLSAAGKPGGEPNYEVIACIGGRGFGVRREDMKKLLLATRGKVFTAQTLDRMVDCTKLAEFRTK